MAWRSFNYLIDKPRVLVVDARSFSCYSAGHIRSSICVRYSASGRTLERVAGPGPPWWSENCWWDRHVIVVTPCDATTGRKRKAAVLENEEPGFAVYDDSSHPVYKFLHKEGLLRSLHLLEKNEGEDDAFSSFARAYPFLITKSTRASEIQSYPTEIVPRLLFLGDLNHAKAEKRLKDLQISQVLTIHTEPLEISKSFVHKFFDLEDASTANISQYFEPMYEFIEQARRTAARVLVHCGAGASRSATLCAAYLMRTKLWGVESTLKFLKGQRSRVNPNSGFLSALHQYSHVLRMDANHTLSTPAKVTDSEFQLHLDVIKGGKSIGHLPLNQNTISFGRGADCNVILDHASISRHHATLGEFESNLELVDVGSTHGTFVNGKVLSTKKILQLGDIIQFGASTRTYRLCNKASCCSLD